MSEKTEREVAIAVLDKARDMLDSFLEKKEKIEDVEKAEVKIPKGAETSIPKAKESAPKVGMIKDKAKPLSANIPKVVKVEGASKEQNEKYDSCVEQVKDSGKDESSAHGICHASIMGKTEKLKSFLDKKAAKRAAKKTIEKKESSEKKEE